MTDLERLKLLTEELDAPGGNTETGCGCMSPPASARMYMDSQLAMLLELPDQRAYWLGRARSVRPNKTKPAGRADGT